MPCLSSHTVVCGGGLQTVGWGLAVAHAGDLGITAASSDLSDLSDLSDGRGWSPRTCVVDEGLQTVVCPRKKRLKAPLTLLCTHTVVASGPPASAQGASEVFFLLVKKKTECPRAARSRVKCLPLLATA